MYAYLCIGGSKGVITCSACIFFRMCDDLGIVVTSTVPPGERWDPEAHNPELCTRSKCSLCFWKKYRAKMEQEMVARSPDGTQCCPWLFVTESGVGCKLCNLRYNQKKTGKKLTLKGHKTAWQQGRAHPSHKGHCVHHEESREHQIAVASFFGVELTTKLAPNTLVDSLPAGIPKPKDWWMALLSAKKTVSARCFGLASRSDDAPEDDATRDGDQASGSQDDIGRCQGKHELQKLLFCMKEVIADRWRGHVVRADDISLSSDAKKPVVEWRFTCVDENLDTHHGLLDLQRPCYESGGSDDTPSHETTHMEMPTFIEQTNAAIKKFATSCRSSRADFPREGTYQPNVVEKFKSVSYFFADGCPEAQKDARLWLGSLPGDKPRHVDRDLLHENRIAVKNPVVDEPKLQNHRQLMIIDKDSPAKNVTYKPKSRAKWVCWQRVLLKHEPERCLMDTVIANLSFAPQRADSESTPWEAMCSTVVATTLTIADESSDERRSGMQREQSLAALKKCCTGAGWILSAMIAEWFLVARKWILRPRDVSLPFAGLDVRIARTWKRLTEEMFFKC